MSKILINSSTGYLVAIAIFSCRIILVHQFDVCSLLSLLIPASKPNQSFKALIVVLGTISGEMKDQRHLSQKGVGDGRKKPLVIGKQKKSSEL